MVAMLLALLALPVAHAAPRARFQVAACPCEHCVSDLHNSVADCESLGLDCGCLLDCKCQHCVVAMDNSVADCESLGLDCSCYHAPPGRGGGGKGGACADFDGRTQELNDECCDEVTEDCSSGRPAVCNIGCAHVLLPYFDDCGGALGADGVAAFSDVVAMCHAAEEPSPLVPDGFSTSYVITGVDDYYDGNYSFIEANCEGDRCDAGDPTTCGGAPLYQQQEEGCFGSSDGCDLPVLYRELKDDGRSMWAVVNGPWIGDLCFDDEPAVHSIARRVSNPGQQPGAPDDNAAYGAWQVLVTTEPGQGIDGGHKAFRDEPTVTIVAGQCPGLRSLKGTVSAAQGDQSSTLYSVDFDASPWAVTQTTPAGLYDIGHAEPTDARSVKFTDGQDCGGVPRTTHITFVGGGSVQMLSASEPRTCHYEITVATPLCYLGGSS